MTLLDLAIIALACAAAIGGWRLGFVARVFAWAGVAAGLAIGIAFVPRVVTSFGGTSADDRVTVAVLFLILCATIGQAFGLGIGLIMHKVVPPQTPLPKWDRAAGAALGFLGVLVLVWMIAPSLATAKGWPARMARGSAVVHAIDSFAPEQPNTFAAWGRSISDAPYPSALGPLDDPPNPGQPPTATLSDDVDRRVRQSVVKITGHACRSIQEGSGWIAKPGLVVTNAHVVAGEDETTVEDANGDEHPATVVAFDPVRDLAVLSVPGLLQPPLRVGTGEQGDTGAVYGHPGGGPLVASPARVGEEILAVGTDIYRTGTSRRHVFVLAAGLKPGDSGGALVDSDGNAIGTAFAIDPGRNNTSYALTNVEVNTILDAVGTEPVGTGGCLTD